MTVVDEPRPPAKPLRILILGGTGFTALTRSATRSLAATS
jgi:hypothetical protein